MRDIREGDVDERSADMKYLYTNAAADIKIARAFLDTLDIRFFLIYYIFFLVSFRIKSLRKYVISRVSAFCSAFVRPSVHSGTVIIT